MQLGIRWKETISMAPSASIVIYGKTSSGWRRGKPVVGKNGKLKPGYFTLNGAETPVENSHFELQFYENGVVKRKNMGSDYAVALTALNKYTKAVTATDLLTDLGVNLPGLAAKEPKDKEDAKTITDYRKSFLFERARGSNANTRLNTISVEGLVDGVLVPAEKKLPEEITQNDIVQFTDNLKNEGRYQATIAGRYMVVRSFLRHCGIDPAKLIRASGNAA
jgi:hypothetical protein